MKKQKLFRIMAGLISLLLTIVLLVCSYFLFYYNTNQYNNQLKVLQNNILVSFQSKVDEVLDSSIEYLAAWMLEEDIIQFASGERVNSFNVLQIFKRNQERFHPFEDLDCLYGVFRPGEDLYITNRGVLHMKNLQKDYGFAADSKSFFDEMGGKTFVNNCYLPPIGEASMTGKRICLFIEREIQGNEGKKIYGFVSLDLVQIAKQLSQVESVAFMAFKGKECFFDFRTEGTNGTKYGIEKQSSSVVHDLTFGVKVTKQEFTWLWYLYIILGIVFVVIGVFGGLWLAKFMHRPIDNILKQISGSNGEFIYDEEAYIRARFTEITNENHQLSEKMNAHKAYLVQNLIRDLLYGMATEEVLQSDSFKGNMERLCGDISIALVQNKNHKAQNIIYVSEIVAFLMEKNENSIVTFLNSDELVVIVKDVTFEEFRGNIEKSVIQINEIYGTSYTGAIGSRHIDSPRELTHLFNDALSYLQACDFYHNKIIVSQEDLQIQKENSYFYPLEYEKNIISCIVNNDFERSFQSIRMILEKNLVESKLSNASLTELKFSFVSTIKRILHALKKTESEIFGEGSVLYLELSACKTPEEISEKIYEMFQAIQRFVEETYNETDNKLIHSLKKYIQENYSCAEMSLMLVAEHFNVTTSYISRLFKQYMNINFKDYLTNYRIEKSVEFLEQNPNLKVADLAKRVGYDNTSRFIRNFKKVKELSPGEYKNKFIMQ